MRTTVCDTEGWRDDGKDETQLHGILNHTQDGYGKRDDDKWKSSKGCAHLNRISLGTQREQKRGETSLCTKGIEWEAGRT